jgi:hypothetical protein
MTRKKRFNKRASKNYGPEEKKRITLSRAHHHQKIKQTQEERGNWWTTSRESLIK